MENLKPENPKPMFDDTHMLVLVERIEWHGKCIYRALVGAKGDPIVYLAASTPEELFDKVRKTFPHKIVVFEHLGMYCASW